MSDSKRLSVDLCVGGGFFLLFGIALCVFESVNLWALLILAYAAAVLLYGLFRLRFPALRAAHCDWRTTCPALAISACVSVAFAWGLSLFLNDMSDPNGTISRLEILLFQLGWISLPAAALFLALYVWQRRKQPSRTGVLLDVGLGVLYLPPFFLTFCLLFLLAEYWMQG